MFHGMCGAETFHQAALSVSLCNMKAGVKVDGKKRVLLIGTGLIGGSIALAIRKETEAVVIGYDINNEQAEKAKQLSVIDKVATNFRKEAECAELIILASPVEETIKIMRELATYQLKENVLITDVGSTKRNIMNLANELWNGDITFIGGHPMAGSHKTGVESAKAHLLENAFYVLTPQPCTSYEKIEELKDLLKGTKANFLVLDAAEHDYIVGVVSHFPHIIASGLVTHVKKHANRNPFINILAAGGFRDITRIASSSPRMWKDIVLQNRDNLLDLLDDWIMEIRNIQSIIQTGNEHLIAGFFEEAKIYRDALPVRSKGAIPAYHDLYVDVIDQTGAIARITGLIAEQEIDITNLNIIEAREGLLGVLRVSFQTEADLSNARKILEQNGYKTY